MINRYGYFIGIAIATTSLAFYAGMKTQEMTTPRPCVANLSITSYPHFIWEQTMLEENIEYGPDSDFYRAGIKTSADLAHKLVEITQDSDYPSSIYVNPRNGAEFYVPGLCRVDSVDWFGDPILVRK